MADPLDLGIPKQFLEDVETVHYLSRINKILTGNRERVLLAAESPPVVASGTYQQTELQAVMDKLDAILLALQGG